MLSVLPKTTFWEAGKLAISTFKEDFHTVFQGYVFFKMALAWWLKVALVTDEVPFFLVLMFLIYMCFERCFVPEDFFTGIARLLRLISFFLIVINTTLVVELPLTPLLVSLNIVFLADFCSTIYTVPNKLSFTVVLCVFIPRKFLPAFVTFVYLWLFFCIIYFIWVMVSFFSVIGCFCCRRSCRLIWLIKDFIRKFQLNLKLYIVHMFGYTEFLCTSKGYF